MIFRPLISSRRWFSAHAFVVGDYTSSGLSKSSIQLISAAQKLGGKVTVGLFGDNAKSAGGEAVTIPGVSSVVLVSGPPHSVADSLAVSIADVAKRLSATHILGSTSSLSKDTIPRIGALLDVQPISDVIEVINESTFKRPMYAGNVIATVESSDSIKVMTIRPTAFPVSEMAPGTPCPVTSEAAPQTPTGIKFESEEVRKNDKPDLATATVVVAGGRGLKSRENFDSVLNPLCEKLKAGLGASRAAVDAGYAPNDLQIGQTGKVVAPDLYIAIGISGAIQHLAGMKDSRTIVAINKDKDAPIFQVADYGLVGDLFELVPSLVKKL